MAHQRFLIRSRRHLNTVLTVTKRILFMVLITSISLLNGCAASTTFRVLDAETKEPIEGAVALAKWIGGRRMGVIAGPTQAYTAKAVEAVSDSEGKFTIPGMTGRLAMQTPHLKVYKPGYVGWDSRRIYLGYRGNDIKRTRAKKRTGFTMKDQDIYLEPWKDEYSFISHSSFVAPPTGFEEGGVKDSKYRKAIDYETPYYLMEWDLLKKKGK